MSAFWIIALLIALVALSELCRRLERTRLDVPMRRPARQCPVCGHVLYAEWCYWPEGTKR